MNINQAFPSKYLKADDLHGKPYKLLMGQVQTEQVQQDHLPVLYFQNAGKGLVLNRINSSTIANMYGEETDNWFGQHITIYPDQTDFGGKRVPCIRVKMEYKAQPQPEAGMPTPGTLGASLPPTQPSTVGPSENPAAGLDDEIPF